ncbi:hypothetical protein PAXRUDRAFT_288959 [Paxillus rubicundulus Ve08.2h10]|uniref:Uncharacterized protein n=1 Tax=Paxillus rubicundulus Ve08.2h10 TaxID=930991 RepID=A0A0D0DFY2_9AGAM|nr:hypothetical protein PAXRUDRAFT_288959 [Paxillus rubicundulus Ve08.2h10]
MESHDDQHPTSLRQPFLAEHATRSGCKRSLYICQSGMNLGVKQRKVCTRGSTHRPGPIVSAAIRLLTGSSYVLSGDIGYGCEDTVEDWFRMSEKPLGVLAPVVSTSPPWVASISWLQAAKIESRTMPLLLFSISVGIGCSEQGLFLSPRPPAPWSAREEGRLRGAITTRHAMRMAPNDISQLIIGVRDASCIQVVL